MTKADEELLAAMRAALLMPNEWRFLLRLLDEATAADAAVAMAGQVAALKVERDAFAVMAGQEMRHFERIEKANGELLSQVAALTAAGNMLFQLHSTDCKAEGGCTALDNWQAAVRARAAPATPSVRMATKVAALTAAGNALCECHDEAMREGVMPTLAGAVCSNATVWRMTARASSPTVAPPAAESVPYGVVHCLPLGPCVECDHKVDCHTVRMRTPTGFVMGCVGCPCPGYSDQLAPAATDTKESTGECGACGAITGRVDQGVFYCGCQDDSDFGMDRWAP